jgi:hypothetical protein
MEAQPPLMSDAEADRTWNLGNECLFGNRSPSTLAIEQEIATLQSWLAQRRDTENMQSSSQPLPTYAQGVVLSSNERQPNLDDDETKRRQAFAPTHKQVKGKAPTCTQPSRTKAILSADAFHIANTKPSQIN